MRLTFDGVGPRYASVRSRPLPAAGLAMAWAGNSLREPCAMPTPDPLDTTPAAAARLRRTLRKHGLYLAKSRSRTPEVPGYGGYWVVDDTNRVVFGAHPYAFSASLTDINEW